MEHVTQAALAKTGMGTPLEFSRLRAALVDRIGKNDEIRCENLRDADLAFKLFAASKDRFGIETVKRHECRHDEGIGDCSGAPSVDA